MSDKVYLVTTGDGSDGDETSVQSVWSTHALGLAALGRLQDEGHAKYGGHHPHGEDYRHSVEEWEVDKGDE